MLNIALWPDIFWYILHTYISVHYPHRETPRCSCQQLQCGVSPWEERVSLLGLNTYVLKNYCSWSTTCVWILSEPRGGKHWTKVVTQSSKRLRGKVWRGRGKEEKATRFISVLCPKKMDSPSSVKATGQIMVVILISTTPALLSDSYSRSQLVPNMSCLTLKCQKS